MKPIYNLIGITVGLALTFVLLICSVEFVSYYVDGYFEKEYTKYGVAQAIDIEMDDLLVVTDEMMAYLKGDREDLVIETTIDGALREFFNAKEKRHMLDVKNLFLAAQELRTFSILFSLIAIGAALYLKKGYRLFQGIQWGIGIFLGLMCLLVGLMQNDFNRYFIKFHHIFFNNDDWILNPKTDLLINIVPEGFFKDTAFFIAGIFLVSAFALWGLSWFLAKRMNTGE